MGHTTIPLSKKSRDLLRAEKNGGESYDELLREMLEETAFEVVTETGDDEPYLVLEYDNMTEGMTPDAPDGWTDCGVKEDGVWVILSTVDADINIPADAVSNADRAVLAIPGGH